MAGDDRRELEIELGRALTAVVAPEEIEFYDDLISAPNRAPKTADHPLGFGVLGSIDPTVSAVMFEIGKSIMDAIWASAGLLAANVLKDSTRELQSQLTTKIREWIKARFNGPAPASLSQETVSRVLADVSKEISSSGLSSSERDKALNAIKLVLTHTGS